MMIPSSEPIEPQGFGVSEGPDGELYGEGFGKNQAFNGFKPSTKPDPRDCIVFPKFIVKFAKPADQRTIFIVIAAYRDPACRFSLWSALTNATFPERIHIGAYEQNSEEDDFTCTDFSRFVDCEKEPEAQACKYKSNIQLRSVDHISGGQGPAVARFQAEQFYNDEDYALQIDSHTWFIEGWDVEIIKNWEMIGNDYAVFSTWPHSFGQMKSGRKITNFQVLCKVEFDFDRMIMNRAGSVAKSTFPDGKPLLIPFAGAGQIFSRGHRIKNVPNDEFANMIYYGEEYTLSARMWTNGYDFYLPSKVVLYHLYGSEMDESGKSPWGGPRKAFFNVEPIKNREVQKKSAARIYYVLGQPLRKENGVIDEPLMTDLRIGEKYGRGFRRSIQQYHWFTGVDILNEKTEDLCSPSHPRSATAGKTVYVDWNDNALLDAQIMHAVDGKGGIPGLLPNEIKSEKRKIWEKHPMWLYDGDKP